MAETTSAGDIIQEALREYFTPAQISQLLPLLLGEVTSGQQINAERLMPLIRNTDVYRQRFSGMAIRQQRGNVAISEAEYLSLERFYKQTMSASGLPAGFYDSPTDFAQLIGNDVSAAEFSQRVSEGYKQMANAPADVKRELRVRYGVTDGELAAYFLDPDKALPLIETQVATARVGAAAARTGITDLTTSTLEGLVRSGVGEQAAEQGFGRIALDRQELYRPLDAGEDQITMQTGMDATFGGNAAAARRIAQRRERRASTFQAGGQYAATGSERTGLTEA